MKAKPHVAILTFDFPPSTGGVQTWLGEMAARWSSHMCLTVITPVAANTSHEPWERFVVPNTHPWTFWRALQAVQPEYLVIGHAHPRLLLAAWLARRPFTLIIHGADFLAARGRWHFPLFVALINKAQRIIANSHALATRYRQHGVHAPLRVVHLGTDPNRFHPPAEPVPHPPTILTVSRLHAYKGLDTLITALPHIRQAVPEVRYLIAGTGPDRPRLEALARQYGVEQAVVFRGYVPDEELPRIYHEADIFALLSREEGGNIEGFGIVLLEAAASGLPTIAAQSGGMPEAIRDGITGVVVPPNDVLAVARHAIDLLQSPEKRRAMGQAGRRWVEEQMNWQRVSEEVARVLLGST
ncbi:MAG: glycosyltransferase family 1 protein [Ardenticatenia bacterium]|nr:MAG: glycosyltransferase family 1 protein [Ardenticatenia bacterium]